MNYLTQIAHEISFLPQNLLSTSNETKWKHFSKLELSQTRSRFYDRQFLFSKERSFIFHHQLAELSLYLAIPPECFGLALSLFDSVMSSSTIETKNFLDFAIACLFLALKVRRSKIEFRSIKRVLKQNFQINLKHIASAERHILINFDFEINHVLPLDFLNILLDGPECFKIYGEKMTLSPGYISKLKYNFKIILRQCLCLTFFDYHMNQYTSLALALVSIMIAREKALGAEKWTDELALKTGYDFKFLEPCYLKMSILFEKYYGMKPFESSNILYSDGKDTDLEDLD